jgi:hypothetical protein
VGSCCVTGVCVVFRRSRNGGTGGSGVVECDRAVGGEQGCSDGSGSISRRFSAAARGLEKGGMGNSDIVNGDLAVRPGDSGGTGDELGVAGCHRRQYRLSLGVVGPVRCICQVDDT